MSTKRTLTAAFMTAAALTVGPNPASALQADEFPSTTVRERGVVMDCAGSAGGFEAHTFLYENQTYGNSIEVVIGSLEDGNGRGKNVKREILDKGKVRASIRIDGAKAKVTGTATKVGKKKPVYEELEDGGYQVVSVGTHRRLATDLVLSYDGHVVPLTCDDAFAYNLKVTKTPIV